MGTRTYDVILTVTDSSDFRNNKVILGNSSGTVGVIANVNATDNTLKVKINNSIQHFTTGEAIHSNTINTSNVIVTQSNAADGTTNVYGLTQSVPNKSYISVFVNTIALNPEMYVFTDNTTREYSVNVAGVVSNQTYNYDTIVLKPEFLYPTGNTIDIRLETGNLQAHAFSASNLSLGNTTTTAISTISDQTSSNFIAAMNSFTQSPLVRLYSIYYPGEWYPPNSQDNPTHSGDGRAWPNDFPLRLAEVRGDQISDLSYNVELGGVNFSAYPINSGSINSGTQGEIEETSIDVFNYDNLITVLVENPFLVGNVSNTVYATVQGEVVTGIDPRTVPTGTTYIDSEHTAALSRARSNGLNYDVDLVNTIYGRDNAAVIYAQALSMNSEDSSAWIQNKIDSRDLVGGVVEIKSTFANFLDYWPEYSTIRGAPASNVYEVYTNLPYRVGDVLTSNADMGNTATILSIEDNSLVITDNSLSVGIGDKLLITNLQADPEAYILDVFRIDGLNSLNGVVASFRLVSWLQYFKNTLPKRKYYKNTCQWKYKGEECQYPGPDGGSIPGTTDKTAPSDSYDVNNQSTTVDKDECAKSFTACELRNNTIHFGAFRGTGRTIPR